MKKLGGELQLREYLLTKRVVAFVGAVSEEEFTEGIARTLFLLDQDPKAEVKVWIHSPGGHAVGGLAFYDLMCESSAPVSTYCLGRAGGIAALLLAAGAPNRRFVDPYSVVSLVDVSLPDGRPYSTSTEMWDLHKVRSALNELLAHRSGQPHDAIREATREGTSLSASAAIVYGFADALESSGDLLAGLDHGE